MSDPTTTNLGLTLPTVGSDANAWGGLVNANFSLIDSLCYALTNPVPTAGLNINANVPFGGFAASGLLAAIFNSQSSLAGTNRVYVAGGELYFNNGSGTVLQMTLAGALNLSGNGGITGMVGTTASVAYSSITQTFTFLQSSTKKGSISVGAVNIFDPATASSNSITIAAPVAPASSYTLTLPAALPSQTLPVNLTSSGVLSTGYPLNITAGNKSVTAAFNTVKTVVAGGISSGGNAPSNSFLIPGNTLRVGSTIRFKVWGTTTSTNADNTSVQIYVGANGTTADVTVFDFVVLVASGGGTNNEFQFEVTLTVTAIGASAAMAEGSGSTFSLGGVGIIALAAAIMRKSASGTFDSTANRYISVVMSTSAGTTTHTVRGASAELVY